MVNENRTANGASAALNEEDRTILDSVERFLADGLALKNWWEQVDATDGYKNRFPLVHTFRRPENSYGFLETASLNDRAIPVMGVVDEVFYDRPKTTEQHQAAMAELMRDQIREFVLHYFMRVSDFRLPQEHVEAATSDIPSYLAAISMRPKEEILCKGMGFSKSFYKMHDTGEIGKFPEEDASQVIDLREIGTTYDWIILKLQVFDFTVSMKPMGTDGPQMTMPLREEGYLILTPDFILNEDNPEPGVLGRYGFGYAFIKNPTRGMFAYGPGEFEVAFQVINFQVSDTGETHVTMAFTSDQPERVMNLKLDPVNWSFSIADLMSFGMTSRVLRPLKEMLDDLPLKADNLDPTLPSISLLNQFTNGQAAEKLAISQEQLFKGFLVKHSMQHYQTILGSLRTWRQIPDWLDEASLPEWVIDGHSS